REAPFHFHRYDRGLEERYVKRISLVEDLRIAMIDWDAGLSMYYQPKLNLRTGQVEKMEALIRWEHPVRGAVSPEEFIPLAEQAGLIGELSRWIVAQVAAQLAAWRQRDIYLQVAVNLSAQDIMRPEMLTYIEEQRERYELPADCLTFEIIESELMENPSEAVVLLQRLRSSGYGLAIDDFGTGYSSLSQLKKMPVNEVKIDCEFVRVLSSDEDDRKIVRSTLALASSFGLDVTAEGVEDEDSLCLLSSWGCEWAQGFYISRGMPGPAVRAWLERFRRRDMSRVTEAFGTKRVKI
ncbi:MAG: putative bifunctional diguanylate cyclase/phosphodiesterase, partial [Spongiibacter sp.]